jgi:hypothetical protein
LNFPLSIAGAAGASAGGPGGIVGAGAGFGSAETVGSATAAGSLTGAGGETKSGGDGAMIWGFSIPSGGATEKMFAGGTVEASGGLATGVGEGDPAAAGAMRGLNRIFGIAGASVGSGDAAGVSGVAAGAAVSAGTSPFAGTPGGVGPSAERSRGFSRRAGLDVAGSSLMQGTEP